jgi:hypothetical protein
MNFDRYILFDLSTYNALSRLLLMMLHQSFFLYFLTLNLLFYLLFFCNLWCQVLLLFVNGYFIFLYLLLSLTAMSLLSLFSCFHSRWWWCVFFSMQRLPLCLLINLFTWRFISLFLFHSILISLLPFRTTLNFIMYASEKLMMRR